VQEAEVMTAEECARQIVRAMERRERMLVMTLKGRLGRWVRLIAPELVDRMAERSVRRGR
jgi:short-subunit dehydrogenase